jgi:hypothetical protein
MPSQPWRLLDVVSLLSRASEDNPGAKLDAFAVDTGGDHLSDHVAHSDSSWTVSNLETIPPALQQNLEP